MNADIDFTTMQARKSEQGRQTFAAGGTVAGGRAGLQSDPHSPGVT